MSSYARTSRRSMADATSRGKENTVGHKCHRRGEVNTNNGHLTESNIARKARPFLAFASLSNDCIIASILSLLRDWYIPFVPHMLSFPIRLFLLFVAIAQHSMNLDFHMHTLRACKMKHALIVCSVGSWRTPAYQASSRVDKQSQRPATHTLDAQDWKFSISAPSLNNSLLPHPLLIQRLPHRACRPQHYIHRNQHPV